MAIYNPIGEMQKFLRISLLTLLVFFTLFGMQTAYSASDLSNVRLPDGFKIDIFADDTTKQGELLAGARFMAFDGNGHLYVSSAKGNKVLMLPDLNKDGIADEVILLADKLNAPQGLAFVDDALLIANQDGVVKLEKKEKLMFREMLQNMDGQIIRHLLSNNCPLVDIRLKILSLVLMDIYLSM